MAQPPIRSIAIVGGGTAGWSAAALLSRVLARSGTSITLIESSDIATVGVGEATIPPIFEFLQTCGIDEVEFIRATNATFKLAIEFRDWLHQGHRYWHPFGGFGLTIDKRPFHHHWWRYAAGGGDGSFADFCPAIALAEQHKFAFPPPNGAFPGGALAFALHFDAGLVAGFLRTFSEANGVKRLDRKVVSAEMAGDERIGALVFEDGERLSADLYVDCSGFRGLLIEGALGAGYHDWRCWLPCDRAVAAPSAHVPDRTPYTIATARPAGWQWRIPLQQRVGNGYVYSSAHIEDQAAADTLVASLDAPALAEPRFLRFIPGQRKRVWVGNCVALGLAAGFLEPLESTSIHLIYTGLNRLLDYFPDTGFDPALQDAYNRETDLEYAHIRDFLLLHYIPNRREGEPFWDAMRALELPETLAQKIALIEHSGRIVSRRRELFSDLSWFFVAHGMGLRAKSYDPLVDIPAEAEVSGIFTQIQAAMAAYRNAAHPHDAILELILDPAETRRPNFGAGGGFTR